ncbi:hypothetical protein DYB32_005008 [Aphanomyces invadans]|uniref:Vacuolar protein 8 n=1 Tax=Aphanomyces invadans TaxID=157072 RepID=A0A3R6YYV4_9STRA|nr:hypothetical protein DYB32_005008 [Aphanomyces invadans]
MDDGDESNNASAIAVNYMALIQEASQGHEVEESPRDGDDPPLTLMETAVATIEEMCQSFQAECDTRLDRMQARVDVAREKLPQMKVWARQQHEAIASLDAQLRESAAKCKTLLQKWTKEKEDRRSEKEWIADVWPDFAVVPPTILRPFMKHAESFEDKEAIAKEASMQLRLLEQGRLVKERLAIASQWSIVNDYYYNSVTGESCWEPPPAMQYVAPTGWDIAEGRWKPGVQLTLEDVPTTTQVHGAAITDGQSIRSARESMGEPSDSEADAPLDPIELRGQVQKEQAVLANLEKDVAASNLRLQTLSHQLQTSIRRHIDSEHAMVQAEYDAQVEAERKRLVKEARDRQAAAMEAQAKATDKKTSSPPKNKLQAAELVVGITDDMIHVQVDPLRPRLCTPASAVPAVQMHVKADEMYLHMEVVRRRVDSLVKLEDSAWESHDAFREMIEKDMHAARKELEAAIQDIDTCKMALESSQARLETIKEAPPMPQLQQSTARNDRLTAFEIYDQQMKAWEEAEVNRRVECEDLAAVIADMQTRLAAATLDRMKDEIAFLESLETCEVDRGAGLWAKKREYEVWRTKMMLDRVEREERLVALTHDLGEYTAELEQAGRLPLQAMNVLEKQRLEAQAEEEMAYYAAKIDMTTTAIQSNEAAKVKLMEMELHALEFHTRRLDEEMQLHQETKGVWMRQKVTGDMEDKHAVRVFDLEQEIAKLQVALELAIQSKRQSDLDRAHADELTEITKAEAIQSLKKQMDVLVAQMQAQQLEHDLRIERLLAEHAVIREKRLEGTSADAVMRMQWLKAVKCELSDHKVLNKHLLCGIAALEKRRATEINDMQARIMAQLSRIHRLEMWNMSLKQSIEANNDVLVHPLQHQLKLEEKVAEHRAEQRILRREVWRQRISAQLLLTSADDLVLFFIQGIAGLCGHANDALRKAGAIPILVELCKLPSLAPTIRTLATTSLGKLSWNTPKSQRHIGWQAKTIWTNWVNKLSAQAADALHESKIDFDDLVAPTSAEMNMTADYGTHERYQTHLDRLHVLRETEYWVSQAPIPVCVNEENVRTIGDTSGALSVLVELSTPQPNVSLSIQEGALGSLAALAMHSRNIHLIGRFRGFLETLLGLCEAAPSRAIQINALHSLTNLSFQNPVHQDAVYSKDGILTLLRVLKSSRDVDVLDFATSALANLTETHVAMVEQLVSEGGLALVLHLSMAPYLCDAVEDGKMDVIQGNLALCVVHILHASPESVLRVWMNDSHEIDKLHQQLPPPTQPGSRSSYLTLCMHLIACGEVCVQAAAVMVLGVVAQDDVVRGELGDAGAIELLMPFMTNDAILDTPIRLSLAEHTAWTLLQLSWNRDNQTRLSLYSSSWRDLCHRPTPSKWTVIQQHVFQLVGNLVFYHPENRHMMLHDNQWVALLVETCGRYDVAWRVDCVRALCALSYENAFAASCEHMPVLVNVLETASGDTTLALHALQWLMNLLVHDTQKSRFVHCPYATEALVRLCGSDTEAIRHRAQQALDLVADIRLPKHMWNTGT